ncbi:MULTISPECIES: asparagine synthase-related protein [Streptomyces]|uniref:Asparagine synthase-related protein n=1 Tax=Streptomyces mirabilis TaxID=68239 RepID=A0ABU3UQR6_9ACTN|nr:MULTISPECIES: asparagine synthase-related protein [Streptomyces]MCX4610070.1 asparagine synthase-related protein [Streptomyces mirabilis]MCX5350307.1 asparagine synthase-related protein [Streptomyces mirabilis]MDU8996277.1 asparagine synthase-related protein [Streptomyces mirabilis]QDN78977.1 asparagine synthase [Streptomyces sp. S1A1-7]QDN88696.1 asparagine synthase [Streptomyces sp. RLB3-6]
MRWLVGWSSTATRAPEIGLAGATGSDGETVHPVGSQLLWGDPDPLWAVGDWRPDEVRVIKADAQNRIAVLGTCGASDEELKVGLFAARGGALRHLTAWSGSYTAVVQVGRRTTVAGDLAGARPVFHTPWAGGTAYATAALPLADLIEANLDFGHLAALLAAPDVPAAVHDSTPYEGVRRIPPGHALIMRAGAREVAGYEPVASLAVAAPTADPDSAVDGVRDALVEAVRARLAAPRHVPGTDIDPGPVPGMGPAERRAARGMPVPGIGADLSGGPASGTLALLAAGLPGAPGTVLGHGTGAGERLLAVTFNDLAVRGREAEVERAGTLAANPRLHHVVVAGGEETLPYADLEGPLTDEPGPSLVTAARHRARLSSGSADHFTGYGARQVLDAHPARLADLLMDRKRRHLVRPVAALAKADGSVMVPARVYGAARKLARTPYRTGVDVLADRLLHRRFDEPGGAVGASLAALTWARPGPAARWLTGEALAEVSVRLQGAAGRTGAVGPGQRPGDFRARAALARHAADLRILEQAAEIRFQRLHAPFLDNQVVRACRELPEALRVQPGARAAILRTVLEGAGVADLPPGWGAPSHASSAAAARTGLRVAADSLIALFDTPLLAQAGLVEARVVRKALRAAAAGEPLPLDGLADLVSLELWLRRLLARRGTCWTGTPARQRAVPAGIVPQGRALGAGAGGRG